MLWRYDLPLKFTFSSETTRGKPILEARPRQGELNKVKSRPAPVEANRTFEVVRRLFNWAIEEEIVTENPVFKLPKPAEETPREPNPDSRRAASALARIGRCEPDRAGRVSAHAVFGAAQERGIGDALGRSRPARALVEYPRRADEDQEALSGAAYAGHARDHRGDQKLSLDPQWVFPRAEGGGPVPETNVTRPFRKLIKSTGTAHFMPHDLLHTVTSHMTAMGISQFDVGKVRHHTLRDSKTSTSRHDHYAYDREKRRALDFWNARLLDIIAGRMNASNVVELARA
jgi:hypothetical protein